MGQGYRFYQRDELDMAMKWCSQAWQPNSRNPEMYAGFGAVLHDRHQYCDAMDVMKQAPALNLPTFQGISANAARVTTLCAVKDETLTAEARAELCNKSEQLYKKADFIELYKGYVCRSWATAYYRRGQYVEAWKMEAKARIAGKQLGKMFVVILEAKMSELQT